MLSFPSQNDTKNFFFSIGRVYSKKQTRVTENQHIFKSGLIKRNMNSSDVNESLSPHKYCDDYVFDASFAENQNKTKRQPTFHL